MTTIDISTARQSILRILVVYTLLTATLQAVNPSDTEQSPQTGKRILHRATEDLFNESAENAQIRDYLDRSLRAFAGMDEGQEKFYWQARTQYIYGFVEQATDRQEAAKGRFLSAAKLAERSLSYGEFSEGVRLLADAYAQLLNYNGLIYKIRTGRKIMELSERAIQLDSTNVKAHLTLAISYLFAPPIAGGSVDRGIDMLKKIQYSTHADRVDRFSINAWLAIAFEKKGNKATANNYVRRALTIFPGNTWMQDLLAEIES